jgi:hypothetical protein
MAGRIVIDARNAGTPGGGITIGGKGEFGTGTMTVSGAGSLVQIIGDGSTTDGRSPGFTVGEAGAGAPFVLNGGKITVNGHQRARQRRIRSRRQRFSGARRLAGRYRTMVVSGVGSSVEVLATHGGFSVGRGGVGTMVVDNGGLGDRERTHRSVCCPAVRER